MEKRQNRGNMARGFGIYVLFTIVFYPLAGVVVAGFNSSIASWMFFAIGLWQLTYVLPLLARYLHRKETQTIIGLCIGTGITMLLNGGCWGFALYIFKDPIVHG